MRVLSQIALWLARRLGERHKDDVLEAADVVLVLAWAGAVLVAWGQPGRRPLGALAAGAVLVVIVGGLGVVLERGTGGRLWRALPSTAIGLALLAAGAVLHARARAALGSGWAPGPEPGAHLVTHGPYAHLRHPAYAGLALMAIGTFLAHPSIAVGAGALGLLGGLAAKAHLEDRRLAKAFGTRWERWAAAVPGWRPAALRRRDRPR